MNKRAQFFIIAALILSGVILTFGKTYTTSRVQDENLKVYDLSSQIQYEASQVIDNGIFNQKSSDEIKEDIKNLTSYYAMLNPDSNIDILIGNVSKVSVVSYNLSSNNVQEIEISPNSVVSPQVASGAAFNLTGTKLKVILTTPSFEEGKKEVSRDIVLDNEQGFYVIVRKKVRDQDVIVFR